MKWTRFGASAVTALSWTSLTMGGAVSTSLAISHSLRKGTTQPCRLAVIA